MGDTERREWTTWIVSPRHTQAGSGPSRVSGFRWNPVSPLLAALAAPCMHGRTRALITDDALPRRPAGFRVGVQGDVAVAEAHVKVSGSRCTDIERAAGEDAESADAVGGAGVSQDQSGFTRILEWDHQP